MRKLISSNWMRLSLSTPLALMLLLEGCLTVTPAPGSDKLRVTRNPSDVSTCTAVGNIKVADNLPPPQAQTEFRNQAIGFGANAALATLVVVGVPVEGVAYRCGP